MNKEIHFRYWIPTDHHMLNNARTFGDLAKLALSIMSRFGQVDLHMVSGPISTGGVGSIEGNRQVFEKTIEALVMKESLVIFSQMPFEDKMVELYKQWHVDNPHEKYCNPILTDFYEPVFASGKVSALHFIYDWKSSHGAKWEHDNCPRWKIKRRYLPEDFLQKTTSL